MNPGTNLGAAVTATLFAMLKHEDLIVFGTVTGGAPPTTASLFAPGAIVCRVDTAAMYVNTGTTASPVWNRTDASGLAAKIKSAVIAGGAAGDLTVTGVAVGDQLVAVVRLDRDATAANVNISSLLAEFSITATNTINNAAGTNTTGDALLVLYVDLT